MFLIFVCHLIVSSCTKNLFPEKLLCDELTVTGDDGNDGVVGTYRLNDKIASKSPDKPVYKLEGKDRYLFFNPTFYGWRISSYFLENLSTEKEGDYLYASKFLLS